MGSNDTNGKEGDTVNTQQAACHKILVSLQKIVDAYATLAKLFVK
jgi:hypothetical protein